MSLRSVLASSQVREQSIYCVHIAVEMAPIAKVSWASVGLVFVVDSHQLGSSTPSRAVCKLLILEILMGSGLCPCLVASSGFMQHFPSPPSFPGAPRSEAWWTWSQPSHHTTPTSTISHSRALTSLFCPCAQVGGLGDVVTALGRAVQEQGHQVEVILPK